MVQCSKCGKQYNAKTGKPIGVEMFLLYELLILVVIVGGCLGLRLALAG